MSIHPLIDELAISKKAKNYFNKLEFYEIIEDPIVINSKNTKVCNQWSFDLGNNSTKFTKQDIKIFIEAVIIARTNFLVTNSPNVKMVFYFWYDDMNGNFYFNLVPLNDEYSANENTVNSIDEIIDDYFAKDACRGIIKFANLIEIDPNDAEKYEPIYKSNLWSVIIP